MGLAAPAEVPDYFILNDQNRTLSTGQTLNASEITRIPINDVIAVKGPRVPDSAGSQKLFRTATIILSEQLLDDHALSFYSYFTQRAESRQPQPYAEGLGTGTSNPFYVATGRRALMVTKLSDDVPNLAMERLPNGDPRFVFAARMGVSYQLERSVNLETWVNDGPVLSIPVVGPPDDPTVELIRPLPAETNRIFYRLDVSY